MAKGKGKGLLAGLKTHSPSVDDASRKLGTRSVNADATRSSPSKQSPTIGPRTA